MAYEKPVDNLPPHFGTTLDYIGSVIVTIGDAISVIGAGIALSQDIAEEEKADQERMETEQRFADMQSQLNLLQKELEALRENDSKKSE